MKLKTSYTNIKPIIMDDNHLINQIRGMYSDVKHSRELLLQITTKENFERIFSPGEQKSIEELGKAAKHRSEVLCSAVSSLEILK